MTGGTGLLKPAVTADAVMFAQAAALDGVYEIGDSIDFGQGRYYQDDAGTVERISGIVKLEYDCYNAADNQTGEYNFHLTNQQNGVYSGVMIRSMKLGAPWGLSIIGGKGTQKDPYRFKILVSDPDNKPIAYHEWYEVGKKLISAQASGSEQMIKDMRKHNSAVRRRRYPAIYLLPRQLC